MARRRVLGASEREALLAIPTEPAELIRRYSFSEADLSLVRQRRGDGNRLGFAVQMCLLRHPGTGLAPDMAAAAGLVEWAAGEIGADPGSWELYGAREETRREHLLELRSYLGLKAFGLAEFKAVGAALDELADRTDKPMALAERALEVLRQCGVVVPGIEVLDRMCSAALTRADRRLYETLAGALDARARRALDGLLRPMEGRSITALTWLRGTPAKASSPQMLEHIARLRAWRDLGLPKGIAVSVHQNRLLKLAREGTQMSPDNIAKLEATRRHATLVACAIEGTATVTDEVVELHDRMIGKAMAAARNAHQDEFQASGKTVNDKVRLYGQVGQALLEARQDGGDPFEAIEAVLPWESFAASVAEAQAIARPHDFDYLYQFAQKYPTFRRYSPEFLDSLEFHAAPSAEAIVEGIAVLRKMNRTGAKSLPAEAPTGFVAPSVLIR